MDRCDVLIVGGGPAGSSCARALTRAGLDVVVMDKAVFPRDKVCAGWITPAVIDALELDVEAYRRAHVFQSIDRFRIGMMNGPSTEARHREAVSFGIRRCEFDDYLLRRSGARLRLGEPVEQLVRNAAGWQVNGTLEAPMLVGAGGHFCPVAKFLGARIGEREVAVMAQEAEFEIPAAQRPSFAFAEGVPELFFCSDLKGYGWAVRKQGFLNIGLGREDPHHLARHVHDFERLLVERGRLPADPHLQFRGHAYLLYPHSTRRLVDAGVLLIGDAAGLAYDRSGEGIRPAVESGLLAAATILQAHRHYSLEVLAGYRAQLKRRYGVRAKPDAKPHLPAPIRARLAGRLMRSAWFTRHVVVDRWFLHRSEPALAPAFPH